MYVAHLLKTYSDDFNKNYRSCSQRYREKFKGSDSNLVQVRKRSKWYIQLDSGFPSSRSN